MGDGAISFEEAYQRLQATVEQLEQGGLPLEESLALYEQGMRLVTLCGRHLAEAEVRLLEIDSALGATLSQLEDVGSAADEALGPWERE